MDAVATGREWRSSTSPPHGARLGTAMAALVAAQLWLVYAAAQDTAAFLIAVAFGISLLVSFRSTLSGLCIIILFQIRVLQGSETISLDEVAYALLFVATLVGWALREGPTELGRRVLSSPLGRGILLFLGVCLASVVTAVVFGWSPLWWFRDFVAFSYMLLFFPIAAALTSRRGAVLLTAALLIVILFHSVLAVAWYAEAIATTKAFWQLEWQRAPLHEVLPMTAVVAGLTGFLLARSARAMAAWVLLALPGVAALAVSQTRGYWLATALAAGSVVVMARGRRVRALWFAAIVVALVVAVGVAVLGGKFVGVVTSMAERLSTISSPLRSLSVRERVAETSAVLALIPGSPIIGHGLGAEVSYMSPVAHRVLTRTYTHNAYLYMLYKLGIVGLGAFAVFYVRALRRVWQSVREAGDGAARIAMTAGLALLLAFLPLSLTSPQYYDKSSALIIALILGAAEAAGQLARRRAGLGARAGV
jgi:O-antigen ligase